MYHHDKVMGGLPVLVQYPIVTLTSGPVKEISRNEILFFLPLCCCDKSAIFYYKVWSELSLASEFVGHQLANLVGIKQPVFLVSAA